MPLSVTTVPSARQWVRVVTDAYRQARRQSDACLDVVAHATGFHAASMITAQCHDACTRARRTAGLDVPAHHLAAMQRIIALQRALAQWRDDAKRHFRTAVQHHVALIDAAKRVQTATNHQSNQRHYALYHQLELCKRAAQTSRDQQLVMRDACHRAAQQTRREVDAAATALPAATPALQAARARLGAAKMALTRAAAGAESQLDVAQCAEERGRALHDPGLPVPDEEKREALDARERREHFLAQRQGAQVAFDAALEAWVTAECAARADEPHDLVFSDDGDSSGGDDVSLESLKTLRPSHGSARGHERDGMNA